MENILFSRSPEFQKKWKKNCKWKIKNTKLQKNYLILETIYKSLRFLWLWQPLDNFKKNSKFFKKKFHSKQLKIFYFPKFMSKNRKWARNSGNSKTGKAESFEKLLWKRKLHEISWLERNKTRKIQSFSTNISPVMGDKRDKFWL